MKVVPRRWKKNCKKNSRKRLKIDVVEKRTKNKDEKDLYEDGKSLATLRTESSHFFTCLFERIFSNTQYRLFFANNYSTNITFPG